MCFFGYVFTSAASSRCVCSWAKFTLILVSIILAAGVDSVWASTKTKGEVDPGYPIESPVARHARSTNARPDQGQEEYLEFKYSPSVRQLAHLVGMSVETTFQVCRDFNFLLILTLIYWMGWPRLTALLEARSEHIRRAIVEAQRLRDDARKRLAEIEQRWAHLDADIAGFEAVANAEMRTEEQALREKTEADIRRILEYADFEIRLGARRAREELVAFGAEMAVAAVRQSIRIDETTDRKLISEFVKEMEDGNKVTESAAGTATGKT